MSVSRRVVNKSSDAGSTASLTREGGGAAPVQRSTQNRSPATSTAASVGAHSAKPSSAPHSASCPPSPMSSSASRQSVLPVGAPSARVSSAGGLVSRVVIDVVASRHNDNAASERRQGSRSSRTTTSGGSIHEDHARLVRASRGSVAAASSVASSSLSHRSVTLMERELGKVLPLDSTGSHVVLTSDDLKRVRDAETLQFLEENSSLFVKYFKETNYAGVTNDDEAGVDGHAPSPLAASRAGHNADDIANHVKALCDEIETFITAVDCEGKSYHVHVDDQGTLHIPVEPLDPNDDTDGVVLADMDDFNDEDIDAFNREFGLHAQDEEGPADGSEEHGPQDEEADTESEGGRGSVRNPFDDGIEADRDSQCSDVLQGSVASTEDALRQRFDAHRKLLSLTGEHSLQKRLEMVVAHHKGKVPRYMAGTVASTAPQVAMPPSPPPAPAPGSKHKAFGVQYCNGKPSCVPPAKAKQMANEPPAIQVRQQRAKLSKDEERRVQFILENDDWDAVPMIADDGTAESGGGGSDTASVTSRATSGLAYDSESASSYAPSNGGFVPDAVTKLRLQSIEEQLQLLQKVRGVGEGDDGLSDGVASSPRSGTVSAQPSVARSVAKSNKSSNSSKTDTTAMGAASAAVSLAPSTAAAERDREAAEKRKKMGDAYLSNYREEKKVREQISQLNDRLRNLSNEMDVMSTPPFSFNMQYEMNQDPSSWAWPSTLQKPSEDTIRSLLQVAQREHRSAQRTRQMYTLPGMSHNDDRASRVLVNNFVPPESSPGAEAEEGLDAEVPAEDETELPPPSTYFHEQLRDRMKRTHAMMHEVEAMVAKGLRDAAAPLPAAQSDSDDEAIDDSIIPEEAPPLPPVETRE